jgi:hypothetical protein
MPKRLPPLLACFLALGAFASACGQTRDGDASSAPGADRPLTKQEFVARADAICKRMTAQSIAAATRLRGRPPEEIGNSALELQGRAIAELSALPVPPADRREIAAVLAHLRRLQAATRLLVEAKGEDALPAVAGIAVETDAVARAAKRYGLFQDCGAYNENPDVQRILRDQQRLRGPNGIGVKPVAPREWAILEIRRFAAALVPTGSSVSRRQNCAGGDSSAPSCVTIELNPSGTDVADRAAQITRLAARAGWTRLKLSATSSGAPSDRPASAVLAFHREGYDATVWLAGAGCTPRLQGSDGPDPRASSRSCIDTIRVIGSP